MIFVDTGAWYALAIPSDPDHDQAKAFVASNAEPFLTTDFIVDELLTLFAVRGQKSKGIEWCHDVLDGGAMRLVRVSEDDFTKSLQVYEQYQDKSWSFTDCTCYVVMEQLGIKHAFSFDQHFRQFGNVTVVPHALG